MVHVIRLTRQNLDMGPVAAGPRVFIATPMYGGMAAATYTMSLAHTPATFFKNGVGLNFSWRSTTAW